MFHPELIERAARARQSPDAGRNPANCPALVLNADYTPLSYYPLSLWPWQTAVKAVFLERVDIVAQYVREVHSPTRTLRSEERRVGKEWRNRSTTQTYKKKSNRQ